jgi:hypothetical protein|nr:MAG TPA: hypothetical protein [Caudoviricetes sp.]
MKDPVLILRKDLCDIFNKSDLPISVKYYILKDIFEETKTLYTKYIEMDSQSEELSEPEECEKTINFTIDKETGEVIDTKEEN